MAYPNWNRDLKKSTFRGIGFLVLSVSDGSDHAITEHRRDGGKGWHEDSSEGLASWSVEGVIVGGKYIEKRADLIEALDTRGAGWWVHPELGRQSVVVRSWRERWSRSAMGAYYYSIEFVEAGYEAEPDPLADEAVDMSFADALDAATAAYMDAFSAVGAVFGGAIAFANNVTAAVSTISNVVNMAASPSLIGGLTGSLGNVVASIDSLTHQPAQMADAWVAMAEQFAYVGWQAGDLILDSLPIPHIPDADDPADINAAAISGLMTTVIATASASALVSNIPATVDEALAALDRVSARLQALADATTDPVTYRAIVQVRSDLDIAVRKAAMNLPRLRTWTPPEAMTATEIAMLFYGDVTRATEIAERNALVNAMWIQSPLRVAVA